MVTRIGPKKPKKIYLREWRDATPGMTQEKLGGLLEVSKATISRWEAWGAGDRKNGREPHDGAIQAIAEVLGREPSDMYHDPREAGSLLALLDKLPKNRRQEAADILKALQKGSERAA